MLISISWIGPQPRNKQLRENCLFIQLRSGLSRLQANRTGHYPVLSASIQTESCHIEIVVIDVTSRRNSLHLMQMGVVVRGAWRWLVPLPKSVCHAQKEPVNCTLQHAKPDW